MRYTNVVTESRLSCYYCGAFFHHQGHGPHQTACAQKTNKEREAWLERNPIYMAAGKTRTIETKVMAMPISTFNGDRTGLYITVDTKALNALFATAKVERIGEGPMLSEPEPESTHEHHHEHRRPALPAPDKKRLLKSRPAHNGQVPYEAVLLALREGEGRVRDITDRLVAKGFKTRAESVRAHLYRLESAKFAEQRAPGLWSATEQAYREQLEPFKVPRLPGKPEGYVSLQSRLLTHLPVDKPFRVSAMYRELAEQVDIGDDLPKNADSFNSMICTMAIQGSVRRLEKGVYIKVGNNGASAGADAA